SQLSLQPPIIIKSPAIKVIRTNEAMALFIFFMMLFFAVNIQQCYKVRSIPTLKYRGVGPEFSGSQNSQSGAKNAAFLIFVYKRRFCMLKVSKTCLGTV